MLLVLMSPILLLLIPVKDLRLQTLQQLHEQAAVVIWTFGLSLQSVFHSVVQVTLTLPVTQTEQHSVSRRPSTESDGMSFCCLPISTFWWKQSSLSQSRIRASLIQGSF
jgi:hypothetical protein